MCIAQVYNNTETDQDESREGIKGGTARRLTEDDSVCDGRHGFGISGWLLFIVVDMAFGCGFCFGESKGRFLLASALAVFILGCLSSRPRHFGTIVIVPEQLDQQ
eukprot:1353567-Amorphochlora_amoeboformis.AAC.1